MIDAVGPNCKYGATSELTRLSLWELQDYINYYYFLLKEVGSPRPGECNLFHISIMTLAPQHQPIERKKRNGKTVEGIKGSNSYN